MRGGTLKNGALQEKRERESGSVMREEGAEGREEGRERNGMYQF